MFNLSLHPIKTLLIEDGKQYQTVLQQILANANIYLDISNQLDEGIAKAEHIAYDVVLLDLGLPDSQGVMTFTTFHNLFPSLPVIILSSPEDQQLAAQAVQIGAKDYIEKDSCLFTDIKEKELLCRFLAHTIYHHKIQSTLFNSQSTMTQGVVHTPELNQVNKSLADELSMRKRYEFIANASKDLLGLIDHNYQFQVVNDAYCLAQNQSRDQIVGKTVAEIWGDEAFEKTIKPCIDSCFAGEEISHAAWFNIHSLGLRFYEVHYYPFRDENQQVTFVVVETRDETIREMARNRLQNINTRLRILHEMDYATTKATTPIAIFRISLSYLEKLVPFDRADLLLLQEGDQFPILISAQNRGKVYSRKVTKSYAQFFIQETLPQGAPKIVSDLHKSMLTKDLGNLLYQQRMASCVLTPLSAEGNMIGVLGLSSAKTDVYTMEHVESLETMVPQFSLTLRNAQLFVKLRQVNVNLQQLASRLVFTQEEERRRISMELHDEAGQHLTALKLSLSRTYEQIPPELYQARNQCNAAITLSATTSEKLRSLAHTLRPPALDLIGLDEAIKDSCNLIARDSGIEITYLGKVPKSLPEHVQISIFRMVQEGLTNIIQHSDASHAEVRLEYESGMMTVLIQDDGCGFKLDSLPPNKVNGMGLAGMRERLNAVAGTLSIFTQPGNGTRLVARIPVKGE